MEDKSEEEEEGEGEEIDIDLNDPDVGKAAVKIQSSFRGHQARKEVGAIKNDNNNGKQQDQDNKVEEEEEIDIDLDDPDVGKAAVKIQSSFRGHQARKEVGAMKEEGSKLTDQSGETDKATSQNAGTCSSTEKSTISTQDETAFDSGTSMSSQNSGQSSKTVVSKDVKPVPVKDAIIKVESVNQSESNDEDESESQADSGSELLSEDNSMLDSSMMVSSSADSSVTAPIRAKKSPFSLVKYFVTMMNITPTLRKHKVGVVGDSPELNNKDSKSDRSSPVSGESLKTKRRLSRKFSKSRNSVGSESMSSSKS